MVKMMGIHMTKEILAVPGVHPSPLYKRTYKSVQDIDEKLTKLIQMAIFQCGTAYESYCV